ncbi:hypothetical protein HJC23_001550 [Cyclotella cryptica]|uniref:Carbohydrate-binding module family 96 domain-containing protein n=1 Tax=Cyclotella cryptica TaxID=29204 RepID=A0ABD3PWM0_9STRA
MTQPSHPINNTRSSKLVEPPCGSTSTERRRNTPQHHQAMPLRRPRAAPFLTTMALVLPPAASATPLSPGITGGYLTSPASRNYIAYTSNTILPSASLPLSSLPELEPTPHSLVTSQYYPGGTCGAADGGERNYDLPMSRMDTPLPLDVQRVYSPGEEVEVRVSLFGIDAGGHFEFHACPLYYPEAPTRECFDARPLMFVRDEYYGAVADERYPERAYLPLVGAFNSEAVVLDERANPSGGEMMEFAYVLKLPEEDDLITYLEGGGANGAPDGMALNSEPIPVLQQPNQQDQLTMAQHFSQETPVDSLQVLVDNNNDNNWRSRQRRRQQAVLTPLTGSLGQQQQQQQQPKIELPETVEAPEPRKQWYATQVDDQYTISNVETVPVTSIVTDGNGTTTITTLEGVTVLTGGPKIPASTTVTWGDKSIYGDGIPVNPSGVTTKPPLPPATTVSATPATTSAATPATTTMAPVPPVDNQPQVNNPGSNPVDGIKPIGANEPQVVSAQVPTSSDPNSNNSTKYVLLRWHYQTARECYPKGYDTYAWPPSWGNWTSPWDGECTDSSTNQEHYWNCAEIQIVIRNTVTPSAAPTQESHTMVVQSENMPTQVNVNGPPDAVPDMMLVGQNELAHLNVLKNDIDPNGDELHLEEVTMPQHGYAAILDGAKELIYAPDLDFVGLDSFEYTVCDSSNQCDTAKIDVMVGSNSDLVFAKDDKAVTTGTEPVTVDVTANDVLQFGDQPKVRSLQPLMVTKVKGGNGGTCVITDDNQVTYTANQGFQGRDRCKYTVCIGENPEVCDEGWLMIKVLPPEGSTDEGEGGQNVSDSPQGDMQIVLSNIGSDGSGAVVALDDSVVTDSRDPPFKVDVLENDEFNGTPFLTEVTQAISGDCSLTEDNQVLYTPTPGFVGWDRCQYTVCVAKDVCDEGRIKIQVMILPQDTSFSSNIVTTTDKVTVESAKPLVVDVTANDVALGTNKPLTVTAASVALHGKCTVTEDNQVEYISDAGFTGWDRCQYTVCMGETCNVGQIGVKVTEPGGKVPTEEVSTGAISPVEQPQKLEALSEETIESSSNSIIMARPDSASVAKGEVSYLDVLANDISPDGHELSIESVTHPHFGNAQVVFGRVEYFPEEGFVGLDSFEYTACDDAGRCDTARVDVTVASEVSSGLNVDTAVVHVDSSTTTDVFAEDDEATTTGSEPVVVDVTANDSSPGSDPLIVSSVSKAMRGDCEVTSDNKVKYTAPERFTGLDRCSYLVCVSNACDKGRIEITVLPPRSDGGVPSNENGLNVVPSDDGSSNSISQLSAPMAGDDNLQKVYADDDSVVTRMNIPVLVDVTKNDFIRGMSPLTITHTGGSQHGECVIEGDQILYTPHDDYVGQDRCGYVVCENGLCDEGIIRIKVVTNGSTLGHYKHSLSSPASSISSLRTSSVQLCSQAALNHEMRRLRGQSHAPINKHGLLGENRRMTVDIHSSCVGSSLVTVAVTPGQTITYTSTYHSKDNGSTSPQTRSVDIHSKYRSATTTEEQNPFVDTKIELEVSADATIMPGFPDQNFGAAPSMLVSSAFSKSGQHESVLKFDTSSVDASVCSDGIVDAKLTIFSLTSSAQGGTFVTTPNMSWTESEVNWNNAPNSNGIVLSSLGQVQAKTYYDIDLSSALVLGKPLSIRILSDASSNFSAQYATRDHSDSSLHPMLRISCILIDGATLKH